MNNLPLLSLAQPLLVGCLTGAQRIVWLQDIQSGLVAGVAGDVVAARLARRVEGFLVRRADVVIAISDRLADAARELGVKQSRIYVIENWSPLSAAPRCGRDNAWSRRHGLTDRPRFVYSGTLARKHSPETLTELAAALPEADVVLVSEGVGADWVRRAANEQGLTNVSVLPLEPHHELPLVLASADVLVALLTEDAASHSVPSKVLSYLCAGRPILAAIPSDNAAAQMITARAGAGVTVAPSDLEGFVGAARVLISSPATAVRMGDSGRQFAEQTFSSDRIATSLMAIVAALDEGV